MQTSMHKHSSQAIVRLACIGRSEEGVDRMVDSWAETSRYFGGRTGGYNGAQVQLGGDWWIVGQRLVDRIVESWEVTDRKTGG